MFSNILSFYPSDVSTPPTDHHLLHHHHQICLQTFPSVPWEAKTAPG
uniref:Uncharacterized protein n=1 Tax=Homo sapiens TaxID=9606 RepID=Q8IVI0_HUMAN|nr:orf2/unknown [Homo sapiens]